jgi:glycosyltransferase involved in cell wall biosynthesis
MISIIITAHNNDFFLYETLDSINKSNVNFDYEILLGVDNCQITMDSIKDNINKISENVKVFYFPKVGTYVIRNSLAKISKFDDLLFVDSDDILTDDTLGFVYENLKKYDLNLQCLVVILISIKLKHIKNTKQVQRDHLVLKKILF